MLSKQRLQTPIVRFRLRLGLSALELRQVDARLCAAQFALEWEMGLGMWVESPFRSSGLEFRTGIRMGQ
jgi:hypothetical protein